MPPSGAHLPSPQQSRTVRSGQEPRRRSQTAQLRCLPYHLNFSTYAKTFSQAFHPPSRSCLRYFRYSVGSLSFSFPLTNFARVTRNSRTYFSIDPSIYLKNLQHLRGGWPPSRRSRFSRRRNRRCTHRGRRWRWSRDDGDGDGCCGGGAGAGEDEEEEEEEEENGVYWWGQLSSLLPRTPIGGGKATLKDCGDVVLAGTRRVFAHVSRKEYFSTPHLYLT